MRAEQQCDNRLTRELVKHLKWIEEQSLDSIVWTADSDLWKLLDGRDNAPSCKEVNYLKSLSSGPSPLKANGGDCPPLVSPLVATRLQRTVSSPLKSPLSSAATEHLGLLSPTLGVRGGGAKRTLVFPDGETNKQNRTLVFPDGDNNKQTLKPSGRLVSSVLSTNNGSVSGGVPTVVVNTTKDAVATKPPDDKPSVKGSLGIFFRKLYNLANIRLDHLCKQLQVRFFFG